MADKSQIHTIYKLADGSRVPSVTTYLGVLDKPAIIHWAWECGVQGLDYRKVRDQAGGTGTIVHYLILCHLSKGEPDFSGYSSQEVATTISPMKKFYEWLAEHTVEPILLEVPMVSEKFKFGGTPDCYCKLDGQLTLLDFKTGKQVYQEAFHQVAAYKKLLAEHGHPVEAVRILRIGKSEDEGFEERSVGNLENHWKIFLSCQKIYELRKQARKDSKEVE